MDKTEELLSSLTISDLDKEASGGIVKYVLIGLGATIILFSSWYFVGTQNDIAIPVDTFRVQHATSALGSHSNAVLDASGYVTARRSATVSSKVTGRVSKVFIEEGDLVQEGQLLAILDDSIPRAQLELAEAQERATRARRIEVVVLIGEAELNFQRTVELEAEKLASTSELDKSRAAFKALGARLKGLDRDVEVAQKTVELQMLQLRDMEIRSPFTGVVILKAAQPGEMISPVSGGGAFIATGICTLVDMNSLEVEVDIGESYIHRVKAGQSATVRLNSYSDLAIPAEVIAIIPTADRNKATVQVRIGFLEKDDRILPEMGVKVAFLESLSESDSEPREKMDGVLVPQNSVTRRKNESIVYVVLDDHVEVRRVTLGASIGDQYNVLSGLDSGEVIVTSLSEELLKQLANGKRIVVN